MDENLMRKMRPLVKVFTRRRFSRYTKIHAQNNEPADFFVLFQQINYPKTTNTSISLVKSFTSGKTSPL